LKKKIVVLDSLAMLVLGSFAFSMDNTANVNEYGKCGPSGCCGSCQMK